jgi:hypothetical protein
VPAGAYGESSTRARREEGNCHGTTRTHNRPATGIHTRHVTRGATDLGHDRSGPLGHPLGERPARSSPPQPRGRRPFPPGAPGGRASTRGVLRRTPRALYVAAGPLGHRLPARSLGGAEDDPIRRNPVICSDCPTDRPSQGDARRRRSERTQSALDRRALPPRHRVYRHTHRFCRRARREGPAPRARGPLQSGHGLR